MLASDFAEDALSQLGGQVRLPALDDPGEPRVLLGRRLASDPREGVLAGRADERGRGAPFRGRRDVSCFEVPTSTDQGFGGVEPAFQPNEYVVLDQGHVERKLWALAGYQSELAPGRTPDDLERRLRARGAEIGATFAEAFVTVRRFR